jgi:hypothetical protein
MFSYSCCLFTEHRVAIKELSDVRLSNSWWRPAVCVEHRIVIGTEMSGNALPVNRRVQHPADVGPGDGPAMDAGANEAARELIHDDEYPVAAEHDRLAANEIHAPEAVWRMADERQPGGSSASRRRAIGFGQHAVHDVELKSRNPRFGCPRIARIISQTFGIDIDQNAGLASVRRT